MVKSLELAIAEVANLPDADQEQIGRRLLSHLEKLRQLRAEIDKMYKGIVEQFDRESTALYGTAHLWDDGIIDPRDTRRILAFTLSIARESLVRPLNPITFGVARM
jgi:acetyl-CoA carboxylase carboxyltransferase component